MKPKNGTTKVAEIATKTAAKGKKGTKEDAEVKSNGKTENKVEDVEMKDVAAGKGKKNKTNGHAENDAMDVDSNVITAAADSSSDVNSDKSNGGDSTKTKAKPKAKETAAPKAAANGPPAAAQKAATSGDAETKKRGRKSEKATGEPTKKFLKLSTDGREKGEVLILGEGDMGQLGLGEDVMEKKKPALVSELSEPCQQIKAGGLHTICLTANGEVFTWGCNDEGALGRKTEEEEDSFLPGKVDFPRRDGAGTEKIIAVSAGDSHSAALTSSQEVLIWGTFRDSSGPTGINKSDKLTVPTPLQSCPVGVVKICSGSNHLVMLTETGDIYTLGSAEQGQLGRVSEYFVSRGGRRGLDLLLLPEMVHFSRPKKRFVDIWAGEFVTFAKEEKGDIYAWGLNNYSQLGLEDTKTYFVPQLVKNFDPTLDWKSFSSGQHHSLALDKNGKVYSLGRKEYGRLGLGPVDSVVESPKPQQITSLSNIVSIDCGNSTSFAVNNKGEVYSWGSHDSLTGQCSNDDDNDDDIVQPTLINSKQLETRKCAMISAGGQHAVMIATKQ